MSRPKIRLTVVDRLGPKGCHRGHKVGDTFDFDTERGQVCPKMCIRDRFHGVLLVPELSANGSQNIYGGATIGIGHETEVRLWERLGRILLQHFQQAVKISPLSGIRPGEAVALPQTVPLKHGDGAVENRTAGPVRHFPGQQIKTVSVQRAGQADLVVGAAEAG